MTRAPCPLTSRLAGATALAIAVLMGGTAQAADVGVSISIRQPGFYGRVDIGNQQPVLIYPQPVIIHPAPHSGLQRPIYLRVPPGHYKQWARYCGQYNACNQPVYFVHDGENGYDDKHHRIKNRQDRRGDKQHDHHGHRH